MGRKFMAVIVGMITAVAIIWVSFMISTMMAPFYPKNLEYMTRAEIDAWVASVPASTFGVVLVGYAIAAFAAGFIATKMGRRWSPGMALALICGGLLTIGQAMTLLVWPQPMWFVAASFVVFIPFALVGYAFAHRVGHQRVMTA